MQIKQSILALSLLLLFVASFHTSAAGIFLLQSTDFTDNGLMDKKYAGNAAGNPNCSGENQSPALVWSNPPANTQSFALVLHDPEGARGLGVTHLVAYNIPPQTTGFAPNQLSAGQGYTGGKNTPGTQHYYGPCPPPGSGSHHYTWTLIATSLPPTLPEGLTREELFSKLRGHALAAAGLIGRFGQ